MRAILMAAVLMMTACDGDDTEAPNVDGAGGVDAGPDGSAACAPGDRSCVCLSPGTACWTCAPGTLAHSACVDACIANTAPSSEWCQP